LGCWPLALHSRTDFIRTAIRNHLNSHADAVKQVAARKILVLGLQHSVSTTCARRFFLEHGLDQ
jgi:hypothetical protein